MTEVADLRGQVAFEIEALNAAGEPLHVAGPNVSLARFGGDAAAALAGRDRLVEKYLSQGPAPERGQSAVVVVMAGAPGAGKSTLVRDPGGPYERYRVIDPDDVKDLLLEELFGLEPWEDLRTRILGDGRPLTWREMASLVHKESVRIMTKARSIALDRGENVVIDGTLANPRTAKMLSGELAASDYRRLELIDIEVPYVEARERALDRWWTGRYGDDPLGGRFVPRAVIDECWDVEGGSRIRENSESFAQRLAGTGDDGIAEISLDVYDLTSSRERLSTRRWVDGRADPMIEIEAVDLVSEGAAAEGADWDRLARFAYFLRRTGRL